MKFDVLNEYLDVPNITQYDDFDCGPAALQALLAYYGIDENEEDLIKELNTTEEDGTYIPDMEHVAQAYGKTIAKCGITYDELVEALKNRNPVLVCIQAWDLENPDKSIEEWREDWSNGHYVIVIGIEDDKVYFEDPSTVGVAYMTKEEFFARWHEDEDGVEYINWGIYFTDLSPIGIRELHLD